MPVYEYECTNCKDRIEVMQKITDDSLKTCMLCGGKLKKLITNTSFVLKGSGWYVTDYPSDDRKKALKEKKPGDAGKDKKNGKKPESPKNPLKLDSK